MHVQKQSVMDWQTDGRTTNKLIPMWRFAGTTKMCLISSWNLYKTHTYWVSFFSTSLQAAVLDSSLYILNKILNKHARLCVSCFNKFGLAFPRNPTSEQKYIYL